MATPPASLPPQLSRHSGALRALLLGLVVAMTAPAFADDLADALRLSRRGEYPQALERLDAHLRQSPNDAQALFTKGVILTEAGRTDEAIAVFTKVTEDFPEMPESYNNLAVLYARQGLYERARMALEMAIRTHPSYATAHENLGDIYVTLASQSYGKAVQLDANSRTARTKLTLSRDLLAVQPKAKPAAAPDERTQPADPAGARQ